MKLSITMMVRNESKHLRDCLNSLQPIMKTINSELIIVDTGSEDNTVEIAKEYTDKVYFHKWNNDFASMRNKTIKYAKGEWLLILDGDEIIENPEGIIEFLNSKKAKKYNTGMLTIKNIFIEEDKSASASFLALRLFKNNNNFQYEGTIHEQPKYQKPVFEIQSQILHYGYLSTDKQLMKYKFQRNVEILKNELKKDPENIYYWYQLSQSYGMYKDYKKSLEANLKAYEIAKKNNISLKNRMYIYNHLAMAYLWNKKYIEVEKLCLEAIEVKDGYIDLYYFLAKAQKNLSKYQEAIVNYQAYLKLLSTNKYLRDPSVTNITVGKYEDVYLDLCMLYYEGNNIEEALKYAKKITSTNILSAAMVYIIKIYLDLKDDQGLKDYYHKEIIKAEKEIIHHFWTCLENEIEKLDKDEKNKIITLFSTGESSYSLFNKVRLHIEKNNQDIDEKIIEEIGKLDFEYIPAFFAEMVYLLLDKDIPLGTVLNNIREYTLQVYIDFLSKKYDNISKLMLIYLKNVQRERALNEIKIKKVLEKSLLILDEISEEEYQYVWNRYIEDGTYYIHQVYNQNIIKNERIYDVKNDEDAFLIYMIFANENKERNKLDYVKYLRKALKVYPKMKKGIEILLEELKGEKPKKYSNNKNSEFEELKQTVKKNINILLKAKKVGEAKTLIDEYLRIVPNDLEMLTLKSELQIQLM